MPLEVITPRDRFKGTAGMFIRKGRASHARLIVFRDAVGALGRPARVVLTVNGATVRIAASPPRDTGCSLRLVMAGRGKAGELSTSRRFYGRLPAERVPCKLVWRFHDGQIGEKENGATPGLEFPIQPAEEPNA